MADDPLKTKQKINNPNQSKVINLTFGWYLNNSRYPLREGNDFTPYFSGEQVFTALAASITKATKSIDIIAWGFDPAMPIVRPNGTWKLEYTYGEILKKAARRGVRVRLLLWYTKASNGQMSNAIGKMGKATIIKINRGTKEAIDYPEKWFTAAEKGTVAHLDVALRAIADQKVAPDEDKRIGAESVSLSFPADHQKSIVIDYGYEGAHGYLMGHNSLTDYWDTVEMKHDDPRRELGKPKAPDEASERWYQAATTIHAKRFRKSTAEYQKMLILYEGAAQKGHIKPSETSSCCTTKAVLP